ncbi:aldehyde dehydrogenase family protein [Bacillus carboniphilus]|uniref:Aldehyde dehydrogenase family protein n=1 Tax=Bacillus carboniphilus TaxID=86663 RepID=A0ABY9JXS1_9BACI|nr:aldehyde dehydrogenase family protein [Bacillus carboniphilus]WLR43322.1 aldehyde dehydrogenase family protein [Bacillus carboniphilus]
MKQHLWINGQEVEAKEYQPLYSPYKNKQIIEVAVAQKENIITAIDVAYQSRGRMKDLSSYERANILQYVANELEERKEEAAKIITKESAKPIRIALGEVERTIETYTFAAEEAKRFYGETIPLDSAKQGANRTAYTIQEPLGVVAAITPFNFPMNLVAHKLGPSIASGNTVVLKPATQTPLSAFFIAELFDNAGLPKGALNIITSSGKEFGDVITEDDRIKAITFTGSPSVGKTLKKKAGLRKTLMELGSNSAIIIDESALIDKIIDRIVQGSFSFSGQVCISVQRIFVHEKIIHSFIEKMVEKTKELKLGDPLLMETEISSMISKEDVKRTKEWIDEAVQHGANVLTGGFEKDDNMMEPTIIYNAPNHVKISCEEAFAPIVVINSFDHLSDAIDHVNDSKYGLQAGIFTEKLAHAFQAVRELEVGGVLVNDIPTFRVDHMPYGGVKESGIGREGIRYAIEELTEKKLVIFNHN